MKRQIARIESTFLGVEDHGIFTAYLHVAYGDGGQGVGGYALDSYSEDVGRRVGTAYGMEFIARIMRACGVDRWEKLVGRTIFVLHDMPDDAATWGTCAVAGIENLPTEKGERFIFADLAADIAP